MVLPADRLSGGLQFLRPAAALGWLCFKQTGSGLCEAMESTIVVEGPIRHSELSGLPVLHGFTRFVNRRRSCTVSYLLARRRLAETVLGQKRPKPLD